MDKFFIGLVIGVFAMCLLITFVPGYEERTLTQCKDAQIAELPIVWQEEKPYCSIDITINGKTKTVSLSDYYEYTK